MNTMVRQIRDIYDLLRSDRALLEKDLGSSTMAQKAEEPINLPTSKPALQPKKVEIEEAQFVPKKEAEQKRKRMPKKAPAFLQKDYIRYPLIFMVSFAFFYVALNFGALYTKVTALLPQPELESQTEGQVLGVVTPDYSAWINKYFFQANNLDVLSPNLDFDRDGLTNYQEFLLRTNPAKQDTDNDDYIDGQEVLNGYNPLYKGRLTAQQKTLIGDFESDNSPNEVADEEIRQAEGWDLRLINNRISYYAVSKLEQGPAKPSNLPLINYNLDQPGELSIPKLGVKAPLIWSKSPDNFDDDLNRGVIHYPGTSLPGQVGVSYISGHSSGYIWSRSDYSTVFTRLNELDSGDEFFITVQNIDGEKLTLRYVVFDENIYEPDDQAQFRSDNNESIVNLSTCWPIGTIAERLVVSARLTGA